MLAALKSRQEALEETLRQRLEELKKLCLREAVSTPVHPVHSSVLVCLYKARVGVTAGIRGKQDLFC